MLVEHILNLAIFVGLLGGLIFTHELGHFLVAKWLGVEVEEFGIGLPPRARTIGQWCGTVFTLNWVPLGGFIRPKGENDPDVPGGLAASSAWKRLAILSAGSGANVLLGLTLLVVGFASGWPEQVRVLTVEPGSPAQTAGMLPEDLIVQVDGAAAHSAATVAETFRAHLGVPMQLTVKRGEDLLTTTIIPNTDWSVEGRPTGMSMTFGLVRYPLLPALGRAWGQMMTHVQETLSLPYKLLNRDVQAEEVRLVSPVGLKQISDRVVQNTRRWNEWFPILSLTATISIALGIANLLPIPALDGGRILFVLVEMALRRRVNPRLERRAQIVGLVALLSLTIILAVQDIFSPIF